MKRLFLILLNVLLINIFLYAQTPQAFQYQAVVRDASGNALINQSVNFRISILSGSVTGTAEYIETHNGVTNAYGVVLLSIGSGTPTLGTLSGINWGTNSYFIKVEADPAGGTSYLDMVTTQLLSVPYAMYSEKAGNVLVYTGGTGIDVTGTTITNTNPDQTVNLTGTGSTSVTGTYPNFIINSTDNNTIYTGGAGIDVTGTTITNTNPDEVVTMISGTGISVTGSYPGFTVTNISPNETHTGDVIGATALTIANGAVTAVKLNSMSATNGQVLKYNGTNWAPSTDLNTGTPGGLNKTVQFNNAGTFGGDTSLIWDNVNKRLGVGLTNPSGRMVIQGSATASPSDPLFEIKNASGQQIMAVYNDSVHFYISDIASNQGGFAVSGRNNAKALTNDFLRINADSTRIYTSDTISGFGVKNIGSTSKTSYLRLTPKNYFIGHQSGDSVTLGTYNSFLGYQSGKNNTVGSNNSFVGFQSGFYNKTGNFNSFYGYQTGFNNISGSSNIYLGYQSGFNNNGNNNSFLGYKSGYANSTGSSNTFLGSESGISNTVGNYNAFIGWKSGWSNTTGSENVALGYYSGYSNINGFSNLFIGTNAGLNNPGGGHNIYLGSESGESSINGDGNICLGFRSGRYFNGCNSNIAIGTYCADNGVGYSYENVFVGFKSGSYNSTGVRNVFIGSWAGSSNTTANFNAFFGYYSGAFNTSGNMNTFIGSGACYSNTVGSNNTSLGGYAGGSNKTGNGNCYFGSSAAQNDTLGSGNVFMGSLSGYNIKNGSNNVVVGYQAGYAANTNYSGNVFIGYNSGFSEVMSNRLYVENSNADKTGALIYGEFDNNKLRVNSMLGVNRDAASNALEVEGNASKTVAGNFIANSDKRIKTNITDINNSLELISKLHPVKFKYSEEWMKKHPSIKDQYYYNFIAQEYGEVFPESLFRSGEFLDGDSKEILQIDTYNAQIISVKAIQDLIKRVEALEKENAELKKSSSIDQLKAEIEFLKSLLVK